MAYALDTHATVRSLQAAGVQPAATEAIVAAIARSEDEVAGKADIAALATKEDLAKLETRILLASLAIAGLLFAALRFFG